MNARKKIMVKSAVAVRRECTLYALLCGAIIIFLLGVVIFYLAALLSLQRHFYTPRGETAVPVSPWIVGGGIVAETVNYHGLRPPSDFPKELIVGHPEKLLSSQELRYPGVGRLLFVSFTIPQTPDQVRRSYEEQLQDQPLLSRSPSASASTLSSRQNGVSYDIAIQPYQQGSTVAIYYRIKS